MVTPTDTIAGHMLVTSNTTWPSVETQEWFFSPQDKALYHHNDQGWHWHAPISWRMCTQKFHRASQQLPELPALAYLTVALTILHGDLYTLTSFAEIAPDNRGGSAEWQEQLQESKMGKVWKIQINISSPVDLIQEAIIDRQAIAVSNSSFQQDSGVAAWLIKGKTSENCIQGLMITPGNPGDHSSFCSEAAGMYGILLTLKTWLGIIDSKGSLEIACNGKLVLEQLKTKKQLDPFVAHVDLLGTCCNLAQQLQGEIQYTHIKGHQDRGHPTALSCTAWLNIEADLIAKNHIDWTHQTKPDYRLPYEPWHLEISGTRTAKNPKQALCKALGHSAH